MAEFFLALELAIAAAAFLSGYLWWGASRRRLRRVSRHEILDHADINRIVTNLNRTQILNSRAACATALAAALAGTHVLIGTVA